jgi:hypothetical protein
MRYVIVVALLCTAAYGAFRLIQHRSDGPLNGMIPGGPLRAGALVGGPHDWPSILHDACATRDCPALDPVELQLLAPELSRYTGIMLVDGKAYIPCDLGFMFNRFEGRQRDVLYLIYLFKSWHADAMESGEAVLRVGGSRYAVLLNRVQDSALVERLKVRLEEMARAWVPSGELGPRPEEAPSDIWFFALDSRGLLEI